jgi:hypothetical protein
MYAIGFDSETLHGEPMTLQFTRGKKKLIEWVNDRKAEKTFFRMLDSITANHGDEIGVVFGFHLPFDMQSAFPLRAEQMSKGEFEFDSNGWSVRGIYGRPTFAKCNKGRKRVLIVDAAGFAIAANLAKVADTYCAHLPKLTRPDGLGSRMFSRSDSAFVDYAIRDAEIAEIFGQIIIGWHHDYDISMSVSGPSMASQVFRHHFVRKPIYSPPEQIKWAAMRSFHGGIQRALHAPAYYKNVQCIDMVSAYPAAMHDMPSFTNHKLYKPFRAKRGCGQVPDMGVYKIRARFHGSHWPALFDWRTFKPLLTEHIETWATGYEINVALETEQIAIDAVEGHYYDAAADNEPSALRAFVDRFFTMKSEASSDTERNVAKLLLNSLYGKFIQHQVDTNGYWDMEADEWVADIAWKAGGLYNPFIASLITAHCRARLVRLEHRYSSLHAATDGLIVPYDRSIRSDKRLGGLTIEAEGDVVILRPKLYIVYSTAAPDDRHPASLAFRGKRIEKYALHGFRGKVQELERLLMSGEREYTYTHVVGMKEKLRGGTYKAPDGKMKPLTHANDFIQRLGQLNFEKKDPVTHGQETLRGKPQEEVF